MRKNDQDKERGKTTQTQGITCKGSTEISLQGVWGWAEIKLYYLDYFGIVWRTCGGRGTEN